MTTPGYSGKPLADKLGIKPGMIAVVLDPPDGYHEIVKTDVPYSVGLGSDKSDFVHLFVTEAKELEKNLAKLLDFIQRDGMVWVSWPKKSSKIPTDITEDTIREICLPLGWVDVKVCAVTEIWSGLKLVIRKERR